MSGFLTRLDRACEVNHSLLCVGLDADPTRMPIPDVFEFNKAIVQATGDLVCAYKPNLAFYEALGLTGLKALEQSLEYIRQQCPQTLIIGDAKRGDIGPSGEAYARAMFQIWGFDAVTVSPWGGRDTVEPFSADDSKGVFIWCRGSNPGSADLQDLIIRPASTSAANSSKEAPVYQHLAEAAQAWNVNDNIGLVAGATVPQQLSEVRRICPNMPMLIPGVGAQGGDLEEAVRCSIDQRGRRALINSSRGIIYASTAPDFAQAARKEAASLRDNINQILESEGKGWH